MLDLRARWHGAPVYVWVGGSTVVVVAGLIVLRRRRAARAGNTVATGSPVSTVGSSPLPGWSGLQGALGPLGGSSPQGPLQGYTSSGEPVYGPPVDPAASDGGQGTLPEAFTNLADKILGIVQSSTQPSQPQAAPSTAVAAPVVSAGSPATTDPTNRYSYAQVVGTGEQIVSSVYSPTYGWLNLTNKGGIFTGGGGSGGDIGSLPYGGSYLGYAATQPDPGGEVATHGTFGSGGLSLLPGGGYQETNAKGETYEFA